MPQETMTMEYPRPTMGKLEEKSDYEWLFIQNFSFINIKRLYVYVYVRF